MSFEQEIATHVDAYRRSGDIGQLLDDLKSFASRLSAADAKAAAEPFRDMPEVVIPLYEHVTAVSPNDAQALVVLANSYWLEVSRRFPADQLARAALADSATSLANDEEDPVALRLAIDTYEGLLGESTHTAQRLALEETLKTLRTWKL